MNVLFRRRFRVAVVLAAVLAATLFALTIILGKKGSFLWLNHDGGKLADRFFRLVTEAGNGAIWIPVLLVVIFTLRRKDAWLLVVAAFVFSTLFTQSVKHLVLPGELRPTRAIGELSLIHTVPGVTLNTVDSFPSGHTGTAFSVYLVFALLIPGPWWIGLGLIYAVAVAYSRIYLAQHFPLDVGAGICVGIVSVLLASMVQRAWWKRKAAIGESCLREQRDGQD
jgi:membrane-associated phospholipid phosphatase